jgi:hypothetical protein
MIRAQHSPLRYLSLASSALRTLTKFVAVLSQNSAALVLSGCQGLFGMAGLASVDGSSCDAAPCAVREPRAQRGPRECRRVYSRAP